MSPSDAVAVRSAPTKYCGVPFVVSVATVILPGSFTLVTMTVTLW